MHVGKPRNRRQPLPQLLGDAQVLGPVVADGAHVNLRRNAEIENLGHHVGGLEVEDRFRKRGRQYLTQLFDVGLRRRVAFLERDQNDAVVEAGRGAVAEREIIRTRRQADVVDDQVAIALGNDFADSILDRLEYLLGLLDACAGRRAHVELNLPTVDQRKEVAADEHEQHAAERQNHHSGNRHDDPPGQQCMQERCVGGAHILKAALEALVDPAENAGAATLFAVLLALEQKTDHDRRQRARKAVGRQHGEHHGEAERREKVFRGAVKKNHRDEHAADGQRRDQSRHRDLGGAVQCRIRKWPMILREQAVSVLDGHGRIRRPECRSPAPGRPASWC